MRRLRRWIFNAAAGVAAVLLLAATAIWVRSYNLPGENPNYALGPEGFHFYLPTQWMWAEWLEGELILYHSSHNPNKNWGVYFSSADHFWTGNDLENEGHAWAGFRVLSVTWTPGESVRAVMLPLPAVALACAGVCGVWFFAMKRDRRKRKLGQCKKCGYDLRASRETCPECGEAIVEKNPDAAAGARLGG